MNQRSDRDSTNLPVSLVSYRLLSAALAVALPACGIFLQSPGALDPLWVRGLLSGWCICLFSLSFHDSYREMLPRLWNGLVWVGLGWYLTVATLNVFSLQYAVGMLIVLAVGGSVLSLSAGGLRVLQWYYGLGVSAVGTAVLAVDMPGSYEGPYMAAVVSLVGVMFLTQRSQHQTEAALRASRRKYESLFKTANDAIIVHGLEGRITDVNPQAAELFGRSADDLVGRTIFDLHPEDAREVAEKKLEDLRRGEAVREEARYKHRNGSTFWGELSASAVEVNGQVVARSMIRDVDEQRRLRARLQEERDGLSKVLETSPVAITIVDDDGTITFANGQAEEVLGLERSTIKDRTYNDPTWNITAADGGEFPEDEFPFVQVMETGEPVFDVEHAIEWPGGERRLLSINGAPFRIEDGHIESIVFALTDITERREMETALRESEQRLQALFDHAQDMIFLIDDEGRYVDVNPAAERLLGYMREELIGTRLWDLMPETNEEEARSIWTALLETGNMEREFQLAAKDGDVLEVECRAVADIQPGLHLSVTRDVTDRRRLEEQADRFFSLSLDLLCIADTNGYFRRLNPAFEEVLGYTEDELLSRSFMEFIHPDDRSATEQVVEQLSGGEDIQKFVNRYRHKGGGYRWIEWHATADPEGKLIYAAARDVTDRRAYEEQLKSAKEKAEEMNRLKSSFLANMSHEIRTPLTSIIGYADLLKVHVSDSDHRFVERVEQSGERLLETLNSVLDLAKLESGQMQVTPEPFDAVEEIRSAADTLEVQAARKDIDLRAELPSRPLPVHMDKGILSRILTNLLGNAVKFTDEGYVRVGCRREDKDLVVEVEDTGIGMDEEFLEDLYEAFRQESMGMARRYEGSGLGLTITKHLVDLIGGRMTVESAKGQGTLFTVSLPWTAVGREVKSRSYVQNNGKSTNELPPGLRVLIVDDDPAVAELVKQMLPGICQFDVAHTSDEALALAREGVFDLILLDINLKGDMDGAEVRARMDENGVLGETKVIAITAYVLPGDRERLLEGGFDGYLAKPFRRHALVDYLTEVMA